MQAVAQQLLVLPAAGTPLTQSVVTYFLQLLHVAVQDLRSHQAGMQVVTYADYC